MNRIDDFLGMHSQQRNKIMTIFGEHEIEREDRREEKKEGIGK